jgi:hypothetical protein
MGVMMVAPRDSSQVDTRAIGKVWMTVASMELLLVVEMGDLKVAY